MENRELNMLRRVTVENGVLEGLPLPIKNYRV